MSNLVAYDFFCGVGGLTRGFLDAGIRVIAGIDSDERCKQAYEFNNPGSLFVCQDITNLDIREIGLQRRLNKGNNVVFAACAPCQPFSRHRKREGKRPEATLLAQFSQLVDLVLPDYVVVENVPGFARVPGFSTFRRFCKILKELDYNFEYGVLDAKGFGVPQNRRRLVLLAVRCGTASLPKSSYGTGGREYVTVRRTISHFPAIAAGEENLDFLNHASAVVSQQNLRRLRATPPDGGDRRAWPEELHLDCHSGDHSGHTDVYGRMFWDRPAPALTGRCISLSNGRYGHPEQDRAISLREAAALQTFPDGYEFFGNRTTIAMQIGNAVPVRLAEKIGKHILSMANSRSVYKEEDLH